MIEEIKESMNCDMDKIIKSLSAQMAKMRTGRANPAVLDNVMVDYYGTPTPVKQVGQVSTPEARLLQIQPFDKSMIGAIEKAIFSANLGVTPSNDGNLVRVPFPALTEETRKDLVRDVKKMVEDAKVAMRNIRRDANDLIKKSEKSKELSEDESKKYQAEVQKVIDVFIQKADEMLDKKEKELMTV